MICLPLNKLLPLLTAMLGGQVIFLNGFRESLSDAFNDFTQRLSITSISIRLGITFALDMTAVQILPAILNQ